MQKSNAYCIAGFIISSLTGCYVSIRQQADKLQHAAAAGYKPAPQLGRQIAIYLNVIQKAHLNATLQ